MEIMIDGKTSIKYTKQGCAVDWRAGMGRRVPDEQLKLMYSTTQFTDVKSPAKQTTRTKSFPVK